jgi:hypothetical protein
VHSCLKSVGAGAKGDRDGAKGDRDGAGRPRGGRSVAQASSRSACDGGSADLRKG